MRASRLPQFLTFSRRQTVAVAGVMSRAAQEPRLTQACAQNLLTVGTQALLFQAHGLWDRLLQIAQYVSETDSCV